MPGLFSRRSKAKDLGRLVSSKEYFGAVSSADIDRLGLSSPTPSTADAHSLPNVPTKDDLPPPPPKDTNEGFVSPARQRNASNGDRSIPASSSPAPPTTANMKEFGQMYSQNGSKFSTAAASSYSTIGSHPLSPNASTLPGNRRLASGGSLLTVPSTSHLGRPNSANSFDTSSSTGSGAAATKLPYVYGYTTEAWHDHLTAARVHALLETCAEQIRSRGLDNPLIFSSMALDLSPVNVASLIKLFSPSTAGQRAPPPAFLEEVRYANPHDLAAVIKWALARLGRVLAVPVPVPGAKKGEPREEMVYVQQRGFLDFEAYNAWREQERDQRFPATAFSSFLSHLGPENVRLLCSLFSLLSSTASYSLKNGMMPGKLCKLFGPLLFGLPEDETFARTYDAYVRASNATEHLLLAYIRFQGTTTTLPPRLGQHVAGYPSMLEMTEVRGGKMVPVTQIERCVRLYSVDLIQTACEIDVAEECGEWRDCMGGEEGVGKDPQLSDKFRKLVNLRGGGVQGRRGGLNKLEGDDALAAHSSLVSKQWGDFMEDGFAATQSSKLAFDLNESARRNRTVKRETIHWNDFSKAGFQGEEDGTLADVLGFDDALAQDVRNWPNERDQLNAKLKSRQDKLPRFEYDTTPYVVASPTMARADGGVDDGHPISRMDETFAEVWADYLLGNGWSNRDELTHRNANFVVVQYKSRPNRSSVGSSSTGSSLPTKFQVREESGAKDERVDAAWFVIQEVVPAQYRADLESVGKGKGKGRAVIRKLIAFRKKDKDKVGTEDVSGGNVEDVFRPGPGGSTKRIMLSDQLKRSGSKNASQTTLKSNRTSVDRERPASALAVGQQDRTNDTTFGNDQVGHTQFRSEGHQTGTSKLMSSLRAKSIRAVKTARRGASSPALKQTDELGATKMQQRGDVDVDRSFTSADFETRSVGEEQGEEDETNGKMNRGELRGDGKRPTEKDDAWIDILVRANGSRMSGQDAPIAGARKTSLGLRSDEISQLSVVEPSNAGTTRLSVGSGSFNGGEGGDLRSSTPTHIATTAANHDADASSRADSRPSSPVEHPPDTTLRMADNSADIPMRDASLRDVSHLRTSPSPPRPAVLPQPAPAIDPVAAARAALKSRKEASARPAAQIDTKKLVESLRAGLSPIEAVRASKGVGAQGGAEEVGEVSLRKVERSTSEGASERGEGGKANGYRDVFAKDPVAGRVADVASRFGGRTGAGQASGIPVIKRKPVVELGEKSLPTAPATPPPNGTADQRPELNDVHATPPLAQRQSLDSTRDPDEIYPEDAASNFDPKDHPSVDSPLIPYQPFTDTGDVEQLTAQQREYTWSRNGLLGSRKAEEEEDDAPTRFAQPYQPGMPLDNVLEESESVLSGSNL
ncbi:hypothetical protein PHSY_006477 [Pseudozyma hubeiensis SY62]|uniref:Meiotically up-regulated protein Msb1/Mug8 domain-containing protein n=1 Tax=Pseudozyma hubeiensis (strain SY62) TaxID=1305764 RepID=R9PCD9_PSEHS|nr:hypothetical protein PHSY_006477 [Pseudozyma hubeiensis SY62]GAC98882.1 hypothetical protein PHSY_006477 [Pseudozyma hubeiensis SY62]